MKYRLKKYEELTITYICIYINTVLYLYIYQYLLRNELIITNDNNISM